MLKTKMSTTKYQKVVSWSLSYGIGSKSLKIVFDYIDQISIRLVIPKFVCTHPDMIKTLA
jgi:hypothetical protein